VTGELHTRAGFALWNEALMLISKNPVRFQNPSKPFGEVIWKSGANLLPLLRIEHLFHWHSLPFFNVFLCLIFKEAWRFGSRLYLHLQSRKNLSWFTRWIRLFSVTGHHIPVNVLRRELEKWFCPNVVRGKLPSYNHNLTKRHKNVAWTHQQIKTVVTAMTSGWAEHRN
jgi:hypothetical protein